VLFSAISHRQLRLIAGASLLAATTVWVACGSSAEAPPPPVKVATTNATLPMSTTTAAAVSNTTFSFPGAAGVISPSLANADLTLSFAHTGEDLASTATVKQPDGSTGTFTSSVTFGSCIFKITAVSGSVGTLKVGDVITVNPCAINIATAGQVADGTTKSTGVTVTLGVAVSQSAPVEVSVSAGGVISVGGAPVGTVTTTTATGTTGTTGTTGH